GLDDEGAELRHGSSTTAPTGAVRAGAATRLTSAGSTNPAFVRHNWTAVTVGSVSINDNPIVETTYRTSAAPPRRHASTRAVSTATSVPCQRKWSNAQPIAWAAGSRSRCSIPLISNLPSVLAAVDQFSNFAKLFLGRAPGRQRLHDEL